MIIKVLHITSVDDDVNMGKFELFNNYPNPFNPQTTLKYEIAHNSAVELKIYDILGNHIKTLVNDYMTRGVHETTWNGKDTGETFFW